MKIEFSAGEAGFHEARLLYRVIGLATAFEPVDPDETALLEDMRAQCKALFELPEYASLAATVGADGDGTIAEPPALGWLRRLLPFTRREELLSAQRRDALERAERSERLLFESIAETAQVARERDALKARIAAAEQSGDAEGDQ